MDIKSEIFRNNFTKAKNRNPSREGRDLEPHYKKIMNCKKKIEDALKCIRKINEKKRKSISNLRSIMENSQNHENNFINNKLKKDKEKEYNSEIQKLNDIIEENKIIEIKKKEILEQREFIQTYKKKINDINSKSELVTNEAIQLGRKDVINECIVYMRDNQMNTEGINTLNNLLKNIHSNI